MRRKIVEVSMITFWGLFVLFLTSCQKDLDDYALPDESISETHIGILKKLGFDTSELVDCGDYYLVEGDIAIPKENMDGYNKLPATRQAHTNAVLSVRNASDIKIKIDASLNSSSNWRTAILNVMQHYNDLGSGIYMYEVSSNPDITISYALMNGWGQGAFPTADGKAGATIIIQDSNIARELTLLSKTFLIAHEMGHNLGFRHTDYLTGYGGYAPEGTYYNSANYIPNTPTGTKNDSDPTSVFNSGDFYRDVIPWVGFSSYDKIAIHYVYPLQLSIQGNDVVDTLFSYTYTTDLNASGSYTLEWDLPSGVRCTYSNDNKAAMLKFPSIGTYEIKCRAVYNSVPKPWVTKTVTCINQPTIIGPDSFEEGSRRNFRIDWGDFTPGGDYTYEWAADLYLEIESSGRSAVMRCFDGGSVHNVYVTIRDKYNRYFTRIHKEFEITKKEGDFGHFEVTVYNGSRNNLNFTLHNANIENRLVPAGETGEFMSHVTPGAYRFTIDLTSQPDSHFVYDKLDFDSYITTRGGSLTIDVEDIGIRVINFGNGSPNYPNIYRWFFEEGEGRGYY